MMSSLSDSANNHFNKKHHNYMYMYEEDTCYLFTHQWGPLRAELEPSCVWFTCTCSCYGTCSTSTCTRTFASLGCIHVLTWEPRLIHEGLQFAEWAGVIIFGRGRRHLILCAQLSPVPPPTRFSHFPPRSMPCNQGEKHREFTTTGLGQLNRK